MHFMVEKETEREKGPNWEKEKKERKIKKGERANACQ